MGPPLLPGPWLVPAWAGLGAVSGLAIRSCDRRLALAEGLQPVSSRLVRAYPPALAAVAFALLAWRLGFDRELLLKSLWAAVLIQVALFDFQHGLVEDLVVLPASAIALLAALLSWPAGAGNLLAGAAAALAFLLIRAFAARRYGTDALGLGDVKLVLLIGLALGLGPGLAALWALILGTVIAGAAAVLMLVTGVKTRYDAIPFAPYLSAGALALLFLEG